MNKRLQRFLTHFILLEVYPELGFLNSYTSNWKVNTASFLLFLDYEECRESQGKRKSKKQKAKNKKLL
jgi:hypothetical protein